MIFVAIIPPNSWPLFKTTPLREFKKITTNHHQNTNHSHWPLNFVAQVLSPLQNLPPSSPSPRPSMTPLCWMEGFLLFKDLSCGSSPTGRVEEEEGGVKGVMGRKGDIL